jgi:Zn-dependent protease
MPSDAGNEGLRRGALLATAEGMISRRGALRIGRVRGIPIEVHPSWLIAFLVVTLSLSVQLDAGALRVPVSAVAALALFASVVGHELAHAIVAIRLGVPVRSITLFVFGGVASLEREPRSPRDELLVAAAGPLASLGIGAVALLLARLPFAPPLLVEVLSWLGRVNVVIAVFNCLPGFPLDGGRMLRALLWARRKDVLAATVTAARTGEVLAYGFIALGVLAAAGGGVAGGLWLAFLGWFLLSAARSSVSDARLRDALSGLTASQVVAIDFPSVSGSLDLASYVEGVVFPTGERVHLVRGAEGVIGLVTLERAVATPRTRWKSASVGEAALPLSTLPRVAAAAPLTAVLEAMGDAPVVVVDGVGVIDRERLSALVQTRLDAQRFGWQRRYAGVAVLVALALAVGGFPP